MGEGKGTRAAKGVAGDESDGGKGKGDDCCQKGIEAFRIGIWVLVGLVEIEALGRFASGTIEGLVVDDVETYGTPELSIVAFGDYGTFGRGTEEFTSRVESSNDLLGEFTVETVLGRPAHGDDEDVAIVAVESQIRLVDDALSRVGHFESD